LIEMSRVSKELLTAQSIAIKNLEQGFQSSEKQLDERLGREGGVSVLK
jgi:hypothetical protein